MKPATRQALLSAVLEGSFVVFGVVLAFAINEWREAAADRARADAALEGIVEELQANREAVESARAYHGSRLERLRELHAGGEEPTPHDFHRGFIAPATPFRTAWESASATGAVAHLPYDTVLQLSRTYAEQERYVVQARSAGEVIYERLLEVGSAGILEKHAQLPSLIGSFSYREAELVERYDQTLGWLEREGGGVRHR